MKLNLGSGCLRKNGFLNIDIDIDVRPDLVLDVKDLSSIKDSSVEEVRASHVLEHICQDECFKALREWWRVLKIGGKVVIAVPDCGWAMRRWVGEKIRDCCLLKAFLGGDQKATPYMLHKNIFWSQRLRRFLNITGFIKVKEKSIKDSGELFFIAEKPKEERSI